MARENPSGMTWVAVFGNQDKDQHVRQDLLPRLDKGTLVLELELSDVRSNASILQMPWGKGQFYLSFKGTERIRLKLGDRTSFIELGPHSGTGTLRLSFAWDCARGWAELALDRPNAAPILGTVISSPQALSLIHM